MHTDIAVLGSTGSIGRQTLEVARALGLRVSVLAAHSNVKLLEEQAREFRPRVVAFMDESAAKDAALVLRDLDIPVLSGLDGICEAAAEPDVGLVLNAVVGTIGLKPTLAAIAAGHDVALANKETLVTGGALVTRAVRERGVRLLPVDSEHSAIFQCIQGEYERRALKRLILTASGGPFRDLAPEQLRDVTPEQALLHPNWTMGPKITIDCATLMNKGLELIEAAWLFDKTGDEIDVVVHPESIVHSLVELADGSVLAQLGVPDMRLPIQYALTWPERVPSLTPRLSLAQAGRLTFREPDAAAFPALPLCREAFKAGGLTPTVLNAANEAAVGLFLRHAVGFCDIPRLVSEALEKIDVTHKTLTVEDIVETDAAARAFVMERAGAAGK